MGLRTTNDEAVEYSKSQYKKVPTYKKGTVVLTAISTYKHVD